MVSDFEHCHFCIKIVREEPNLSVMPGKILNFSLFEFLHLCPRNILEYIKKERKGKKTTQFNKVLVAFISVKVLSLLFL